MRAHATKNRRQQRRGMTSVLAMLYLVLFATLAVGFYASTNTQSQIVANDERIARSQLACESGLDFMRYQLGRVNIPPSTPAEQVVEELYADLRTQLEGTGNLRGQPIVFNGNTIQIPGYGGSIFLDSAGHQRFRATITDWAGEIVVKIDGIAGDTQASRAITMDFTRASHPTNVFDYAVASKGQIQVLKGTISSVDGVDPSIAKLMSALTADPSIYVKGGNIGGDLSIIEDSTVVVTGGTVAGSSIPSVILSDHVNVVDVPQFPIIDTSVYLPYATNVYNPALRVQQNIRIPAGTNPRFNGGDTVQGIMYVESPNVITFRGDFNLQGFVVFENSGDTSINAMDFRGSVMQSPLPSGEQFDPLRATSGLAILAPTVRVSMSGASSSYLRGNLISGSFFYDGAAITKIDQGTIMTYDETPNSAVFDGKGIQFTATGASNLPTAGITYSTYYHPNPASYQEVSP